MLEALGLYKTFKTGERAAYPLLGANLTVNDGEIVGIYGKSGEGKSTFANILCGLCAPDAGNVYLDECPLYGKGNIFNFKLGKKVQIIPQQPYGAFDPSQRVGAAIREVIEVNVRGVSRKQAHAEAERLFERMLLDIGLLDRLPLQLSGGQAQRAAIARALAMSPDVIISDEATAMLDTASQTQILKILCGLSKTEGISVIFISHDLNMLKYVADKIYRLNGGVFAPMNDMEKNK